MKRVFIYFISVFIIILNTYLAFCWQPESKMFAKDGTSKETISNTETLYKLDKEKVIEQLSDEDKMDFEKIIKKLSTFDSGRIKEYWEDTNEEEGIINAFKLLKKRLSSEDYRKIEEISSSFIQLDKINKKIKNN